MSDTRSPRYGTVDRDYAIRLATTAPADDGPIHMVNLMRYRERADYAAAGGGEADGTAISGREADDRYAPLDVLAEIGAEIVFVGDVDQQLLGVEPAWHRVAVVRYPSRRSFIEMQQRRDFQERHVHKDAGMERTIVIGCAPMPVPELLGGAEPIPPERWGELEFPPTADDGPVMVTHVIRFHDPTVTDTPADPADTPADMRAYTEAAAAVAHRHGGRIAGWFAAEGTVVGDGRTWHQVRFNAFPSKRAFMAVVMDPDRLAAQRGHRDVAIADTYTMIVRPTLDRL